MSNKVVRLKPYIEYAVVRTDADGARIEMAANYLAIYGTMREARSAMKEIRLNGSLRIAQLLTAEVEHGNE